MNPWQFVGFFKKKELFTHNGTKSTGIGLFDFVSKLENIGVGEIVLNSIERDGKMTGYDLDTVEKVRSIFKGPITVIGGAGDLKDIKIEVDIVDVFRPSNESPEIAKQAAQIGAKTLWLQYGIQHEEAKKIASENNMNYFENLCIKQEYQKIFEKMNPVFPVLKK